MRNPEALAPEPEALTPDSEAVWFPAQRAACSMAWRGGSWYGGGRQWTVAERGAFLDPGGADPGEEPAAAYRGGRRGRAGGRAGGGGGETGGPGGREAGTGQLVVS